MPKERDPFRQYVEQEVGNKKWKCQFCGIESSGSATRIRAHLAGIPGYGIKGCEKVDHLVRAEASKGIKGVLDKSTGGTLGKGTEGTVFGASRSVLPSEGASNPNDTQNSNQHGCAPQQQSFYQPTGTGTAPACPQDQVSLPPSDMPLDNLDNTQQSHPSNRRLDAAHGNENASSLQPLSSLCISEPPALPELSTHLEFGTGTALACPQDEVSLPPGDMPLGNLDNTQQSDLLNHWLDASHENEIASPFQQPLIDRSAILSELLAPPELPTHLGFGDGITPYSPLYSDWSNRHLFLPENLLQSRGVIANASEEIETDELHNQTVGSSLQTDQFLDADRANRLQDCGQPHGVEVVPVPGGTGPTDPVQHPGRLPPRCDKEDGNDIHQFLSPTPMDIDPSTASQQLEASTNTRGPSLAHASAPPQLQTVPHGCINLTTMHPNPTLASSLSEKQLVTSHPQALMDMPSSSQAPNNAPPPPQIPPCGTGLIGSSSIPELDTNGGAPMMSHPNTRNNFQENRALKRKLGEVNKLLEHVMVGEAFKKNTTKILDYLVGNQKSRLGICGMGGVGKTTIMLHIHNRLLEEANYGSVLWIDVSQDFETRKLQDTIWEALEALGLDELQEKDVRKREKDVRKRAAMLCNHLVAHLTKKGKLTIILDDVWECIDLTEVGIPVKVDGIKLVLTTRFFDICHQMQCQMIKIEPLSNIEAKSLFLEKLGSEVALDLEIEEVVMSVIKECAGLPLAIIMTARSMRGVTNAFEWKDCLEKLKESDIGKTDMEKVVERLKFSYNRLGDHKYQQCFLSCALYPEDRLIDKFELIEFFIDQGLISQLNTREKQYDRGLTILQKLVNACLLEDHKGQVKMHDLIRDMALHVMSETSIVKARKQLRRIPSEEYWTDALEKVSLMENDIEEFPLNMSPNCPKLSTFLLNRSLFCEVIPNSFFKQLWGLKVLNLSRCYLKELPNSISDLVNLRALLLQYCPGLCRIPYLGKLKSLRKLDICYSVGVKVLEGLEMLVNLRYLDLSHTCIDRLPKETLGALRNLQYLKVHIVNEEDITNLWALETLVCYFEDVDDFNKFVRVAFEKRNNPRYYNLNVGQGQEELKTYVDVSGDDQFRNCERSVNIETRSHAIVSVGGEINGSGICILIPQDVQVLRAINCDSTTNLFDVSLLENLEELIIVKWKNLRVLNGGQDDEIIDIHDSPAPAPTPLLFPSLRVLIIWECPKLKYLFGHGPKFDLPHLRKIAIHDCEEMLGIVSPPPLPAPNLPSLEEIYVLRCDKMKRVVESEWLPHFPNLRYISLHYCENMEEIIRGPPPYMPVEEISLEWLSVEGCHNMRELFSHEWLLHLRNLKGFDVADCKGMMEIISRWDKTKKEA